jgi:hypothetical protein
MNKVEFKTEDGNIVSFLMTTPTIEKDTSIPDYFSLYPTGLPEWLKPVQIGGKEYYDVADDPRASLPWHFGESLRLGEITIVSENKDIRNGPISVNFKGPFGGVYAPYKPTYYFDAEGRPFNVKKDTYGYYFNGTNWMAGGIQPGGGLSYAEVPAGNLPAWTATVDPQSGTRDPGLTAIMQWRMEHAGAPHQ